MGKEFDDEKNPYLSVEKLTSLEMRMKDKPDIFEGIGKLKEIIGEDVYKKYFSEIKNINKRDGLLLVLADNFFHRSMIERDYIPAMKEAFGVERIQIIG